MAGLLPAIQLSCERLRPRVLHLELRLQPFDRAHSSMVVLLTAGRRSLRMNFSTPVVVAPKVSGHGIGPFTTSDNP